MSSHRGIFYFISHPYATLLHLMPAGAGHCTNALPKFSMCSTWYYVVSPPFLVSNNGFAAKRSRGELAARRNVRAAK